MRGKKTREEERCGTSLERKTSVRLYRNIFVMSAAIAKDSPNAEEQRNEKGIVIMGSVL